MRPSLSGPGIWHNKITGPDFGRSIYDATEPDFIHIGLPRTGATFLQMEVFPSYEQGRRVFSDDRIGGRLFENGLQNVEDLHQIRSDAKIIAVIRNQPSIINSYYRTYIKGGGVWTFPHFAQEITTNGKYDYYQLLSRCFGVFGQDRCLVLLYEELMSKPFEFLTQLLGFIGVKNMKPHCLAPIRPGPSSVYNEMVRLVNVLARHLKRQTIEDLHEHMGDTARHTTTDQLRARMATLGIVIDNKLIKRLVGAEKLKRQKGFARCKDRIKENYDASNRKLEELLGRSLRHYGY